MITCKDIFDMLQICCPYDWDKEIYIDINGCLRISFDNSMIKQAEVDYIQNKLGCKNVTFTGRDGKCELAIKLKNESVQW